MDRSDYHDIIDPITEQVIDHYMRNESKYVEGLRCTGKDIKKVVSHAASACMGDTNPDGVSHALAALSRAYKAVLYEQATDPDIDRDVEDIRVGMTE